MRRKRLPHFLDRLNHTPGGLNHIRPLKKRLITDHAVMQQALISGSRRSMELAGVIELHVDLANIHERSGNLCTHLDGDALIWLNVDQQFIRVQIFHACVAKENERRSSKVDGDLRGSLREAFACAKVKWDAGPTPVVNGEFERNKSLHVGAWGYVGFLAIAGRMRTNI